MLTESNAFRDLVSKTFDDMDDSGDGVVDEAELYSGLLLVHLKLSKYAGPSATFPPDRDTCERLFQAADLNNSGGLDRNQFHWVMSVLSAEIFFRMFVHYVVMILCVPVLASRVISLARIPKDTYLELAARQALSMGVFFLAVPFLWNIINERYSGGSASGSPNSDTVGTADADADVSESLVPSKREEQRQRRRLKKSRMLQPHEDSGIPI